MYKNERILAFIPARGGSKGIPGKNIAMLGGKPLIAHTIEAAIESRRFDEIIVSTDSESIESVAKEYGACVPYLRPKALAQDTSKVIDAQLDMLQNLKEQGKVFDIIVLLQPTSPFRTASDIVGALDSFISQNLISLASVSAVTDHPLLIRTIAPSTRLEPLLQAQSDVRRQDFPAYYRVNGAIYINRTSSLNERTSQNDNEYGYIIDPSHALDIDSPLDLAFARWVLEF